MINNSARDVVTSSPHVSFADSISSRNGGRPSCIIELSTTNNCAAIARQTTDRVRRAWCTCRPQSAQTAKRAVLGTALMIVGAVSWVGVSMCGKKIYRWPEFYAPFFVVYFVISSLLLVFPLHLFARVIWTKGSFNIKGSIRDSLRVFGEEGLSASPYKAMGKLFAFCVLWNVTSYVYIRALSLQSLLNAVVLYATNSNFVYLMSWIVLQKRFIAMRIVALIISMTGVIFITYVDSRFASEKMWGSVLAVIATGCSASYKVIFRRILGDITCDQVACLLSGIGLCNLATMWPIVLLLWLTNTEPLDWSKLPWDAVFGVSAFALVLNFLLHFGALVTYNIMIQASFIFAVPVCAVAIILLEGVENLHMKGLQIGAYILIALGFAINILPAGFYKGFLKAIHWKSADVTRNHAESHMTPRQRVSSMVD